MESESAAAPASPPDVDARAPEERASGAADEALSPAVRRLVRQYALDITGIHGTGPEGRLRVGDVIGLLGGRGDAASGAKLADARVPDDGPGDDAREAAAEDRRERAARPAAGARAAPRQTPTPVTTVFECDLSRVLAHRKRQRQASVELLLTSYYVAACREALKAVPEIVASDEAERAPLGVVIESAEGDETHVLVEQSAVGAGAPVDRLHALDALLRAGSPDLSRAQLRIHHYGPSGSLLATPTPIAAGHAASLGIGRVRRQITLGRGEADEAPRAAAVAYVSLSFDPERLTLARANRFLSRWARALETWPD
jgi:2-oxoglutarate dehydrogenase E2 component (dihydrolipoamide succinyltransferase)